MLGVYPKLWNVFQCHVLLAKDGKNRLANVHAAFEFFHKQLESTERKGVSARKGKEEKEREEERKERTVTSSMSWESTAKVRTVSQTFHLRCKRSGNE
jgi:hypothetical protein